MAAVFGLIVAGGAPWATTGDGEDAAADAGHADPALHERALLGLAEAQARLGPGASASDLLLAAAELVAARHGTGGHDTQTIARSLTAAAAFVGSPQAQTNDTGAHAIVLALTAFQLQRLGVETPHTLVTMASNAPSAVLALLAANHYTPDADSLGAILALSDLEPTLEQALASLISAFTAYQQADRDVDDLPDLATVLVARRDMLLAAIDLEAVLARLAPTKNNAPLQISNILSIDMGPAPTHYGAQPFMLLIDGGGDDSYANNAGGSGVWVPRCGLTSGRGAAALFDFKGNDRYIGGLDCGANGGGWGGSGLVYDAKGNDLYRAGSKATNGGAYQLGTGLILDLEGDDVYEAGDSQTNGGGAILAAGAIVDVKGVDTYVAGREATNGGGTDRGFGLIIEGQGNDQFLALDRGTNGGGAALGSGLILDSAGHDTYITGKEGANGGGFDLGVGALIDLDGWDTYRTAGFGGNGGGARGGVGALIDAIGNDRYEGSSTGTNGGAYAGGFGLLVDHGGEDVYFAHAGGVNGGASGESDNVCVLGLCQKIDFAWGLLVDSGGSDRFDEQDPEGTGADVTLVPKGRVGAQLDVIPDP